LRIEGQAILECGDGVTALESGITDAALQSASRSGADGKAASPMPHSKALRALKIVRQVQLIGLEPGKRINESAGTVVLEPCLGTPSIVCCIINYAVMNGILVDISKTGKV